MKRLLMLVAVPAVLLAGCSGGDNPTAAGDSTPPAGSVIPSAGPATGSAGATTTPGPVTPTLTQQAGQEAGPSGKPKPNTSGTKATAVSRCRSKDLKLKIAGGDAGAGTYRENLVFTNKSSHLCTLYGYPGVSWVTGSSGKQVNDPFNRATGTRRTVPLPPGGTAHAVLQQHSTGAFAAAACKPVDVRGFRVYPPDETASIFVSQPQEVCSVKGVNTAEVFVIESGAS